MRTEKQKKVRGQVLLYCFNNNINLHSKEGKNIDLPVTWRCLIDVLCKRELKRPAAWEVLNLIFLGEPIPPTLGIEAFKIVINGEGKTLTQVEKDPHELEYWGVTATEVRTMYTSMIFPSMDTSKILAKFITKKYAYAAKLQTASSC